MTPQRRSASDASAAVRCVTSATTLHTGTCMLEDDPSDGVAVNRVSNTARLEGQDKQSPNRENATTMHGLNTAVDNVICDTSQVSLSAVDL